MLKTNNHVISTYTPLPWLLASKRDDNSQKYADDNPGGIAGTAPKYAATNVMPEPTEAQLLKSGMGTSWSLYILK